MSFLDVMKEDALKVFDVNLRREYYSKEVIEDSLKRSDVFKCNEDELPILSEIAGLKDSNADRFF